MKFKATKKSVLPTEKISRTVPAKDTATAATSGQPASTPAAASASEGPSPEAAEAVKPISGSKAAGVILKKAEPAPEPRRGGASWFVPVRKPSVFGSDKAK